VKNTSSAEEKGYDAGKKVSGIKRHIAVDTEGLPHAIHITTANVPDKLAAATMIKKYKAHLKKVKNILVDGAYTGEPFANSVKQSINATVEIVKRSDLRKFTTIPKRWVVERSFAWLEKCRRLWKNCERKLSSSLAMVQLAFVRLVVKRY
jgi:transposase